MQLKVTQKLNSKQEIEMVFEDVDLQDVIKKAGPVLSFDSKCPFCNGEEFILETRNAGDKGQFKYTSYKCLGCGAERTFGKHTDGASFFLKEWREAYKGNQQ